MAVGGGRKIKRILCLHGSQQCGEIFSQRISGLVSKLKGEFELVFPDGWSATPSTKHDS